MALDTDDAQRRPAPLAAVTRQLAMRACRRG